MEPYKSQSLTIYSVHGFFTKHQCLISFEPNSWVRRICCWFMGYDSKESSLFLPVGYSERYPERQEVHVEYWVSYVLAESWIWIQPAPSEYASQSSFESVCENYMLAFIFFEFSSESDIEIPTMCISVFLFS